MWDGIIIVKLARLAGVSRSTIYTIEGGQSVQLSNLYKIAMALKVHQGRLYVEDISDEAFRENFKKMVQEILEEIFVVHSPIKKS